MTRRSAHATFTTPDFATPWPLGAFLSYVNIVVAYTVMEVCWNTARIMLGCRHHNGPVLRSHV
jgi:hypothetical protein